MSAATIGISLNRPTLSNYLLCIALTGGTITLAASIKSSDLPSAARTKQAKVFVLRHLPEPLKPLVKYEPRAEEFKRAIQSPHCWIVGSTNSGKSFASREIVAEWIRRNPDGIVQWCDINHGKPDRETGEIDRKMGLPRECIRCSLDDIRAAVVTEVDELTRRKETCQALAFGSGKAPYMQPRLLAIEELDSTTQSLNEGKGKNGPFSQNLRELLKQGHGYGITLLLIGQTLAVEETGISLATQDQLAKLMIGKNTINATQVKRFGGNTDELMASCEQAIVDGKRPAIAQFGADPPIAITIPDLSHTRDYQIAYIAARDPDQEWWDLVWTTEKEVWMREVVRASPKAMLKDVILPGFGIDIRDSRYTRFIKPIYDQFKQEYQTL
ncbi:MAG: hypothetical protein F6J87_14895 [Spirulina sp. SIO3F2]|nr:hypothetical protein [Spirulina sp. SIO3F2]